MENALDTEIHKSSYAWPCLNFLCHFYIGVINIWLKSNQWDAFEQATKSDPLPDVKATERYEGEFSVEKKFNFDIAQNAACDMMASSGTLAIDTDSSIISL